MPKNTQSPETLLLQQRAQRLLDQGMRSHARYRKFDIPQQLILEEANAWDELLSKGACPNLMLDYSIQDKNMFHLGRLVVQFEPLFQVYQKHHGPLDYKEKHTFSEYKTLPKLVVGLWREAKRDRVKFMDDQGLRTKDPDTWALEKIKTLKNNGITTTLTSQRKSILDDVLTHQFLLKISSNDTNSVLMSCLLEEGMWFCSEKEEKMAFSKGTKERLPHIHALLVSHKEKKLLTSHVSSIASSKPSRPPKLL